MRISKISVTNYPPIKELSIEDMGNVVIIAGANGAGKSRLKDAIIQTFQGNPLSSMEIVATRNEEKDKHFGDTILHVKQGEQNQNLVNYMQSRSYGRGRYVGSVVQIDSQRNTQNIKYQQVDWFGNDPDDADTPANFYISNLFSNRWQNFMDYIHQKSATRDNKIAQAVKNKDAESVDEILKNHPSPMAKYQDLFSRMLPGKTLNDIEPKSPREFTYQDDNGNALPFSSLSSGEQEVIKVVFDLARKEIRHSVIIIDEPELHLHPSLVFKLVETLKTLGDGTNQFIYLSHSPDLISTYYSSGDVYFIDAIKEGGKNEAHKLSDLKNDHPEVANMIGDNLGLFAAGKTMVFVEGEDSSVDRLTYQLIAEKYATGVKVVPLGGVSNLMTMTRVKDELEKSVFGIKFGLIRDRDGLSETEVTELESKGSIKCLKKRHIENYLLDEEIIAKVCKHLYLTDGKPNLENPTWIKSELKKIAESQLSVNLLQSYKEMLSNKTGFNIPTVRRATTKTPDVIATELIPLTQTSLYELTNSLDSISLSAWLEEEKNRLTEALKSDEWTDIFHGKLIFKQLCGKVLKCDENQARHAYVEIALKNKPEILRDIEQILVDFNS